MTPPLTAESEEELKSLLKVKEGSEKVGLKLNIQKTKIMASGPITSGQMETLETDRFYFWGAPSHCRCLLQPWSEKTFAPWKESCDQSGQYIKKQRHYFANKDPFVKAMVFPVVMLDVRVGLQRKLSVKELMLLNCGVGEESWESLGLQGDPTSPSWRRSVPGVHWRDWCWSWNSNTLATWCEELTHWKRPWFWEGLGQEEKGTTEDEMVGWHHWLNGHEFGDGSWWWTGRPGVLPFMGSQRVGPDWATELTDTSHWVQNVCSLYLCFLCCPACRIIDTVFLNSICMHSYTVFVFLFLTDSLAIHYKYSSVCISVPDFITIPLAHPSTLLK